MKIDKNKLLEKKEFVRRWKQHNSNGMTLHITDSDNKQRSLCNRVKEEMDTKEVEDPVRLIENDLAKICRHCLRSYRYNQKVKEAKKKHRQGQSLREIGKEFGHGIQWAKKAIGEENIDEEYSTSIPLKKQWYNKFKEGEKSIHFDKKDFDCEVGDRVRLIKGYNPDYGQIIKELSDKYTKKAKEVSDEELSKGCISREWLYNYIGSKNGKTTLYVFKEKEVC